MPDLQTHASPVPGHPLRALRDYVAAGACYAVLFALAYRTATGSGELTPVWLTSALAAWLVARFGVGMLVPITLGAAPTYVLMVPAVFTNRRIAEAVALMALIRAMEAIVAARLWRLLEGRLRYTADRLLEPVAYIAVAVAAPVFSATFSQVIGVGFDLWEVSTFWLRWFHWWAGNAAGILIGLPLLQSLPDIGGLVRRASPRDLARAATLAAAAGAVLWAVLAHAGGMMFFCLLFPVLLLSTVWFGKAGVRLCALVLTCVMIAGVVEGIGPFALGSVWRTDLTLQFLLMLVALVALLLPAIHAGRALSQRLPASLLLGGWALGGGGCSPWSRSSRSGRMRPTLRCLPTMPGSPSASGFSFLRTSCATRRRSSRSRPGWTGRGGRNMPRRPALYGVTMEYGAWG